MSHSTKRRCPWPQLVGNELYESYHDTEWGRKVSGEAKLFERLSLEAFQSGLSWLTILRKRENFRAAFAGFEPEKVANFQEADVMRLMNDSGIVRNRAKIEATVNNAQKLLEMPETLAEQLEHHRPSRRVTTLPIPAQTPESQALAKTLKRAGFRFVGPTTAYAMMQAVGVVNDHVPECWLYQELGA